MNEGSHSIKFKVVMGEGATQTIKRLSSSPQSFNELYEMVHSRLSDKLHGEDTFYIYYEDLCNGLIRIEDDTDMRCAVEHCELYSRKSLKLYVYLYQLDTTISRVRKDYDVVDDQNNDNDSSDEDNSDSDEEPESLVRPQPDSEEQHVVEEDKAKLEPNEPIMAPKDSLDVKFDQVIPDGKSEEDDDKSSSSASSVEELGDDYDNAQISMFNMQNDEEPEEPEAPKEKNRSDEKEPASEASRVNYKNDENMEMKKGNEAQRQQLDYNPLDFISPEMEKKLVEESKEEAKEPNIMVNNQEFENNVYAEPVMREDPPKANRPSVAKKPRFRQPRYSVYEPVFAKKINQLAGNELPKESIFTGIANHLKQSFIGMTEEEADQLMRIDESCMELSNQDVIVAKPGTVVKKCWRLKNLGSKTWPKDTRIVSVTDNLLFCPPRITTFLKPGEMMEIGVNFLIPADSPDNNDIKEYIMRLYSDELKCFGEPIIATCQIGTLLFDDALQNLSEEDIECPRVAHEGDFVENYKIAADLYYQRNEPFAKIVYDLQKADRN